MTYLKHHFVATLLYVSVLTMGIGLFAVIHFNHQKNQQIILDRYRAESAYHFQEVSVKIENAFKQIYLCLRVIARLPGVRALEVNEQNGHQFHGGDGIEDNALLSIQEIYNNPTFPI